MTKEEMAIQIDMVKAIVNTFAHPEDKKLKDNPLVNKVMLEFTGRIIKDILAIGKQSKKGISFPVLKNAFCYLFAKTVDAVLTAHNEKGILSGTNLPYDFNDIQSGACGVSRWFSKYNADPDDECALGEQYFFSFQDICVKYQDQIQQSSPLMAQLIIGAMTAMIPYAIQRGYEIIEK